MRTSRSGLAYAELGKERRDTSHGAFRCEAFKRAGNLIGQSAALNNLGVVCQLEGQWDEAEAHYEQASDTDSKIGSTLRPAFGADEYRRDSDRPWGLVRGRSASRCHAALLESVAIPILSGAVHLYLDECRCELAVTRVR